MSNTEIISILRDFLESEAEYFWMIDERVHLGVDFELFEEDFRPTGADLLATQLRRYSEDPGWSWWESLKAPNQEDVASYGVAALLPLVRLSRSAAKEILSGFDAGWCGHPEAVVPTLVSRAGLKIEDIGGSGSFTPPCRVGRWYDDRTWHWSGPVSYVPGLIHFPTDPRDTGWARDSAHPPPTVAFLFLTRSELNQSQIWRDYLTEAGAKARVYAHTKDLESLEPGSLLRAFQIADRVPTEWGTISLVMATIAMIRTALEDHDVTHFVLASESCVPIKPFAVLSRSLRFDPRSRLATFSPEAVRRSGNLQKARRLSLLEGIGSEHAMFQEQWMCLSREDAIVVTSRDWLDHFRKVWAPDECYFATVLRASGRIPGVGIVNRPITWTRWHGGAHPQYLDRVSPRLAGELADSGCFFARKFRPSSDIGRWELHLDTRSSSAAI